MWSANSSAASRSTRPRTSTQPSRRMPARISPGRELVAGELGQRVALRQVAVVRLGMLRPAAVVLEQAHAGLVPQHQHASLGFAVGVRAVLRRQPVDLGEQLLVLPAKSSVASVGRSAAAAHTAVARRCPPAPE